MYFRLPDSPNDLFDLKVLCWSLFWLALSSVLIMSGLWLLLDGLPLIFWRSLSPDLLNIVSALLIFWIVIAVLFFVRPGEQMRIQELRNQPSWIFYAYWGLVFGPLLWSAAQCSYVQVCTVSWDSNWWLGLVPPLALIFLKLLNEFLPLKNNPFKFTRFASSAVSANEDEFEFSAPARNAAVAIAALKGYVNVVAIYGGFGFGKSSYARMVVEATDPKKTLYTYISLTETNEATDFSKLFQERWLETLASRYPKFDVTSQIPFMYSILRESGQGLLSDIMNILSALNRGLIGTRARFYDDYYGSRPAETSRTVGTIFANIPEIQEDTWIIMIDELERAQIDEIYRVVEIIERFKNEGRSGLPIKLVFVLCISEPEFRNYIDSCRSHDPRYGPLRTFFFEDQKSITKRTSIPPVDLQLRYTHVDSLMRKMAAENGLTVEDVPDNISPHVFGDPETRYLDSHKEALEYIVGNLADESPRTIGRVMTGVDFFLRSFRDKTGGLQKCPIRFADLVALELVRIKYPWVIEFFTKTVSYLISKNSWAGAESYIMRKDLERKKTQILDWITLETGHKFEESEKEIVRHLVGFVAHCYFEFIAQNYDSYQKIRYFGTSSYPENLYEYLTTVSGGMETVHRRLSSLFVTHRNGDSSFLEKIDNQELIEYARMVFHIGSATRSIRKNITDELRERLLSGRIPVDPGNPDDTQVDGAMYQVLFQPLLLLEQDRRSSDAHASEDVEYSYKVVKDLLASPKLPISTKLVIIGYFFDMDKAQGNMELRLKHAFKKFLPHYRAELKTLIDNVFKDADRKYFNGKEIIYDFEENYVYMMYHMWSGSTDAWEEIERIHAVAARGLETRPNALRWYWRRYPYEKDWSSADDVFDDFRHSLGEVDGALYMPLELLIRITKKSELVNDDEIAKKMAFWDVIKDDERVKKRQEIKDNDHTLRARWLIGDFLK